MSTLRFWMACAVPLLAIAAPPEALAPPPQPPKNPKVFTSEAGLVDLAHGLLFFNLTDPDLLRPESGIEDDRGRYLGEAGSIAALRLSDGQKVWQTPRVSGPMYVVKDLLVGWAADDREIVLAVLDATSGKLLRRISVGELPPAPTIRDCAPHPHPIVTTRYTWRGSTFERVTTFISCPTLLGGGVQRTDEEIAAWRATCTEHVSRTRWNLATGAQDPSDPSPGVNGQAGEVVPRLDSVDKVSYRGVDLVPEATALTGRRQSDRKKLWSVPIVAPRFSQPDPCPQMPLAPARP